MSVCKGKGELGAPCASCLDWVVLCVVESLDEAVCKHVHLSLGVTHQIDGTSFLRCLWTSSIASFGIGTGIVVIVWIVIEGVVPRSVRRVDLRLEDLVVDTRIVKAQVEQILIWEVGFESYDFTG